ncbi:hypothetical protein D6825_00950 [Candidatus Woesearchaeota archaeon]|nr:MAG: hypothetical protein D6825_00950 [Candidatus Woesearchaeota archaeon]
MRIVTLALLVLLLALPSIACTIPYSTQVIDKTATLCVDVFYLDRPLVINESDVVLDCAGAVLKSWSGGSAVRIVGVENVTVRDCRIVSYDVGFEVSDSRRVFLEDNHLVKNKLGSRFFNTSDSATLNHDVSLLRSFDVADSRDNVLSLTNKRVSGSFCRVNFCNEDRNAIERFLVPKTSKEDMRAWLFESLGVKEPLKDWVFKFFTG